MLLTFWRVSLTCIIEFLKISNFDGPNSQSQYKFQFWNNQTTCSWKNIISMILLQKSKFNPLFGRWPLLRNQRFCESMREGIKTVPNFSYNWHIATSSRKNRSIKHFKHSSFLKSLKQFLLSAKHSPLLPFSHPICVSRHNEISEDDLPSEQTNG